VIRRSGANLDKSVSAAVGVERFNAFTEALKEGNLQELPNRTKALHGLLDLLDSHVGIGRN
jgi:hypothetical protein